jgi:hypothetical protein
LGAEPETFFVFEVEGLLFEEVPEGAAVLFRYMSILLVVRFTIEGMEVTHLLSPRFSVPFSFL